MAVVTLTAGVALSDTMTGVAFAYATPPGVPPSIAGTTTTATIGDTTVAVADAAAADGVAAGAAAVCASTVACGVTAVVALGVGYGVYKTVSWLWGPHHVVPPPISVNDTWSTGITVTSYSIPSTSSITFTHPAGTYNFSLWGVANGHVLNNCGVCSGNISYTAGSMTITVGNPPPQATTTGILLCNGSGQKLAAYGSTTTDLCGAASASINSTTAVRPQQVINLDVSCNDGSGGTVAHAVSTTPAFDDTATQPPVMNAVACPNGTYPGAATATLGCTANCGSMPATQTLSTTTAPSFPNGGTSNGCAAVGSGCAPTWQVETAQGTWVDYVPSPGGSSTPPAPSRCEWKSGSIDGGALPSSDCTATNQQPGPAPNTTGDDSCVPSGAAAFDPLEWVYRPAKCAMVWVWNNVASPGLQTLFVPSTSAQDTLQSDLSSFQTKPPFSLALGFGAWLNPFTSLGGSSCSDWVVHVDGHDMGLLCSSSFIQQMHSDRGVLLTLMLITAFGGFLWSLWYAMIPVFRVSPTSRALEGFGDSGGAEYSPLGGSYSGEDILDAYESGRSDGRDGY